MDAFSSLIHKLSQFVSALVFLIDWNKARKTLQAWVSKSDALQILDWAARHRCGHRAFLQLGGAELLASAVHNAAPTRIGFSDRLDLALGRAGAIDFLKTRKMVDLADVLFNLNEFLYVR